jgi:hypothetical protein
MKSRFLYLSLVIMLLLAGCGEVPAPPGPGQSGTAPPYPQPPTAAGNPSPVPGRTLILGPTPIRCVDISVPIHADICTPTPSSAERDAVAALGLPGTIEFELQRAIYLSRQQGIPWRPAAIEVYYDPGMLTLTETVTLVQQYGIKVIHQSERYHGISGEAPLDVVSGLAAEPGIVSVGLVGIGYIDRPPCPTPGGPTPAPCIRP